MNPTRACYTMYTPYFSLNIFLHYTTHRGSGDGFMELPLQWRFLGPGGTPPFFQGKAESMVISIVIPISRCCLPNDEGPGPPNIFPRIATAPMRYGAKRGCGGRSWWSYRIQPNEAVYIVEYNKLNIIN